jgi:uncharacterized protein YggE
VGMATVTVRGAAVVQGTPDEVIVVLSLSAERERPELAYEDDASQSAALEGMFDEPAIGSGARSTVGVSVDRNDEYGEHGRREQRGYRASTRNQAQP